MPGIQVALSLLGGGFILDFRFWILRKGYQPQMDADERELNLSGVSVSSVAEINFFDLKSACYVG
jgi:hypothetical protein